MKILKRTPGVHHPCFFSADKKRYGRIHLPVAPGCNIQCAYCRRDYDCVNENRPGVSKGVVSPARALERLTESLKAMPNLSVAAVAGPGDAFADPETTLETFRLIRERFSAMSLCVSSNGLNLAPYVSDLKGLGVNFVTVTVNALDPGIGALLVDEVREEGKVLAGQEGAGILIERQLEAVSRLKEKAITVKINTVAVPDINMDHSLIMARRFASMGVDLMNILPLIPVEGTRMEGITPPSPEKIRYLRRAAQAFLPQMHHCKRCRADAAGCLE